MELSVETYIGRQVWCATAEFSEGAFEENEHRKEG